MNAEELLKNIENINLVEEDEENRLCLDHPDTIKERNRLSVIVAGGNSKKFLGKEIKLSDIDTMKSEEIKKLYCKYEARLGASMTKTLGNTFINLYVMGMSKFFKVNNPPQFVQDLEEDYFINQALNITCCELYYRFGLYLAPFTAMLTSSKHVDFQGEPDSLKGGEEKEKEEEED